MFLEVTIAITVTKTFCDFAESVIAICAFGKMYDVLIRKKLELVLSLFISKRIIEANPFVP